MVNQLKIITMTRLALYDKHEGPADRAANDYFRHDYIYRNNLGTRLAVGFGSIVILVIYWLQAIIINEVDIFELNFQQYATDSLMFILAVLAVYSLIGTIQGTRQYYLVQKRLSQYQALVRQLERLEERAHRVYDDETADINESSPAMRTSPGARPPERMKRAPIAEHTAPLVRTGSASSGQGERRSAGYTRPPRTAPPDTTRPLRPMPAADATRVPRPAPSDATKMPRPAPPGATRPPRPPESKLPPRPATGYTRPRPSVPPSDIPPRPRPLPGTATPPTGATLPEDATTLEHTKIPAPPRNPEGS